MASSECLFAIRYSPWSPPLQRSDIASMKAETTNTRCTPTSQASSGRIESGVDVHEGLQHLDRRDRDDRGEQLLLQPAEIDLGHPVRPVRMAAGIDLRDEILVAGKHHDQDQIAGQRHVDQRQHAEDDVGFLGARRVDDELPQHHAEFQQQHREADDEAEIERRHQPAAVEEQAFEAALDALQRRIGPIGSRLLGQIRSSA